MRARVLVGLWDGNRKGAEVEVDETSDRILLALSLRNIERLPEPDVEPEPESAEDIPAEPVTEPEPEPKPAAKPRRTRRKGGDS